MYVPIYKVLNVDSFICQSVYSILCILLVRLQQFICPSETHTGLLKGPQYYISFSLTSLQELFISVTFHVGQIYGFKDIESIDELVTFTNHNESHPYIEAL